MSDEVAIHTLDSAAAPPDASGVAGALRGLMVIVLIGASVVLLALLGLQWPIIKEPGPPAGYGPQFERILAVGESSRGWFGAVVDISVYAVLIAIIVFAVRTLLSGTRQWLGGLMVAGMLGMAYVAGMVLYIGPMVGACGFSLVVFAGLVAWIVAGADDDPIPNGAVVPDAAATGDAV
jgi:hypothetical protein